MMIKKHLNLIISLICAAVCAAVLVLSSDALDSYSGEEELRIAEESVRSAAVRCYASEGRYPKSVQYLKEHYSLNVDEEHYFIVYEPQGGNIMPVITVMPKDE